MIGATALALLLGFSFSSRVMEYVSRGQDAQTLLTDDGKTFVWEASLEAVRLRPLLGYGYVVGARNAIRDHWRFTHWVPPHAHNEFIQVTLEGGVVALALVLYIYGHVLWISIHGVGRGPCQLFLLIVFLQMGLITLEAGGTLGYAYRSAAGVFIMCCVGVLGGAAEKVREYRVGRQTTISAVNPSLLGSSI
jgi:O-antigen ligase